MEAGVSDTFCILTHLLLKTIVWGMYQYEPHFSDEDWCPEMTSFLPKVRWQWQGMNLGTWALKLMSRDTTSMLMDIRKSGQVLVIY